LYRRASLLYIKIGSKEEVGGDPPHGNQTPFTALKLTGA
jgi:hypothetical protein